MKLERKVRLCSAAAAVLIAAIALTLTLMTVGDRLPPLLPPTTAAAKA